MPDEDPANDPDGDAEIEDNDLIEYLINDALHEMIAGAQQAPGIILVAKEDDEVE